MSENDYIETTQYRTKAKAEAESDTRIVDANIHFLALPTLFEYENAISLYQSGKAYLYPMVSTKGLRVENGEIFFEGDNLHSISVAEFQNMHTNAYKRRYRKNRYSPPQCILQYHSQRILFIITSR